MYKHLEEDKLESAQEVKEVGNVDFLLQPSTIRISFFPAPSGIQLNCFEFANEIGRAIEHVCSLLNRGILGKAVNQVVLGMTQK